MSFADMGFEWCWMQLWRLVGEAIDTRRTTEIHDKRALEDWARFFERLGRPC